MASTFSPNLNLILQATGEDTGAWGENLNNGVFSIVDAVLGNVLTLPLSSTDITLNTAQTQNNFINLTGTLTANVNVIFPQIGRNYFVQNNTTGAFTVTLKTSAVGGATAKVIQGSSGFLILDGTNAYIASVGFSAVQQGGGTGQGSSKIYIGWLGSFLGLQVDNTNFSSTWPIGIGGNAATATLATSAMTAATATVATSANNVDCSNVTGLSAAKIGTYAFLKNSSGAVINPGGTVNGVSLIWSDAKDEGAGAVGGGTWMCMGNGNIGSSTVYVRVA